MAKITEFTVEGSGSFPFDMLRYDGAYPATTDDAIALDHENWRNRSNMNRGSNERYTVKLRTHGPITPDRWRSFGWQVTAERKF